MMADSGGYSPSPYPEHQEATSESRSKKHSGGGWLEGSTHTCMGGLTSDGETSPEIRCRPSSMTSDNISDSNQCSHPAGINAVIMHLLDGRRSQNRGSATSDTLVPTSCTARVFSDSERDSPHSELIHPVITEAVTAEHTIISNNKT